MEAVEIETGYGKVVVYPPHEGWYEAERRVLYSIQVSQKRGETAEVHMSLPDLRRFLTEALAALPEEGDDAE